MDFQQFQINRETGFAKVCNLEKFELATFFSFFEVGIQWRKICYVISNKSKFHFLWLWYRQCLGELLCNFQIYAQSRWHCCFCHLHFDIKIEEKKYQVLGHYMYDFHDSTDIFVNPSFLPFCTRQMLHPELALKPGILVPKVAQDISKFKMEHMCIIRFSAKCQ